MALWDYAFISSVTIERSAREVWPYFFEKKGTWTTRGYSTTAGERGQVGEVYMYERDVQGMRLSSFFEAIKIVPEKQLVLKISHRRSDESAARLVGYDIVTLQESSGRTQVTLLQAVAIPMPDVDLEAESAKQDAMLSGLLQKLKSAAEAG